MSENIPFDLQMDIMNRLPVKCLLRFRTVSKRWKSGIDMINFQVSYGVRSSNNCCMILRCSQGSMPYMLSFRANLSHSPLATRLNDLTLLPIGTCHGIWCFSYGRSIMATLWNPSIQRSINSLAPVFQRLATTHKTLIGFGVRPDTLDPTIVKISYPDCGQGNWSVYVFTLSSMYWKEVGVECLPRESIRFNRKSQVVVGQLIFWVGHERFVDEYGVTLKRALLVSFDMVGHFFQLHEIDSIFRDGLTLPIYISSLGNSLIVSCSTDGLGLFILIGWSILVEGSSVSTFSLRFVYETPSFVRLIGFTNDEQPIVEVPTTDQMHNSVQVYKQDTQSFHDMGIQGVAGSFYIGPYKESLILLPYPNRELYCEFLRGMDLS